jgi:hypothetical protein
MTKAHKCGNRTIRVDEIDAAVDNIISACSGSLNALCATEILGRITRQNLPILTPNWSTGRAWWARQHFARGHTAARRVGPTYSRAGPKTGRIVRTGHQAVRLDMEADRREVLRVVGTPGYRGAKHLVALDEYPGRIRPRTDPVGPWRRVSTHRADGPKRVCSRVAASPSGYGRQRHLRNDHRP